MALLPSIPLPQMQTLKTNFFCSRCPTVTKIYMLNNYAKKKIFDLHAQLYKIPRYTIKFKRM